MDLPSVCPQQRSDDNSLSAQRKAEKHKHDFFALWTWTGPSHASDRVIGQTQLIDSLPLRP
jgi:hypothetical protein